MNRASYIVLASLLLLAVGTLSVSLNILLRGGLYRRLQPQSRPRRWVLLFLMILFAVFTVWFPIWMTWPQSALAKALTVVFALAFGITGLALRWGGFMDTLYERRGWPLR